MHTVFSMPEASETALDFLLNELADFR